MEQQETGFTQETVTDYGQHQSAEVGELIASLAKAQENFTDPKKDKQGQYGKHATMAGVYDSIRGALNKQGIYVAVYKSANHALGTVGVCVRFHKGEQYIGAFATTPIKADRQSYIWAQASGWTYLERYLASGLAAVAPDDDDDGATVANNANADAGEVKQRHSASAKPKPQPGGTGIRSQFFGEAQKHGWGLADIKAYISEIFKTGSTASLTEQQLADTLEAFSKMTPEEFHAANTGTE